MSCPAFAKGRDNMIFSERDKRRAFFLGGLMAAVSFLCIFGYRVLIPTYDDWLLFSRDGVDNMQHYQGWVAYRRTPWQFPIGLIEGILYPDKISVIYTDSVPLFAVIFKILSPILPETFQYFGIFGILCAFLLGGYASSFVFHFTGQRVYSVICSLFFSTAFVFLHRMFYHTALSAQWIVVASLYLWLAVEYGEEGFGVKRAVLWGLLSVTALLTEAYFLPMVWGIMVCDIIGYGLYKRGFWDLILSGLECMLPAAAVTMFFGWIFGLFYGEVDSTGLGLGVYTFNLINFINPFWMSSVIPWLPSDFFQYEGLAYLGVGMFFLIFVMAVFWLAKSFGTRDSDRYDKRLVHIGEYSDRQAGGYRLTPLLIFIVGFTVAAVSPTISFGNHRITVPVPEVMRTLWSTFRSSGRLIWPVYYLIILAVCIGLCRAVKNPRGSMAILCMGLLLQMYDAHGFIGDLHTKFAPRQTYMSSLSDPGWDRIAQDYEHIMICPDVHDIYYTYEGEELEYYALKNGMTMNIIYTARVVSDRVNARTERLLDDIRSGRAACDEKTVYVFLDGKKDAGLNLYYYDLNGFTIGVAQKL